MNLKFSPIKILIFLAAFVNLSSAFNPPQVGEYTSFFTFAGTSSKYKNLDASLIGESYIKYDGKIYEIVEYQSYFLYNTDIGIGIFDGGSYNGRKIFYYIPTLIKKSLYCRYPNSHYEGSFGSYSFDCRDYPVNPYSERKAAVGLYYLYAVPVATCKANENFNTQTKQCEAPCGKGQSWDQDSNKCYIDCTDKAKNMWGYPDGSCMNCSKEKTYIGAAKCICKYFGKKFTPPAKVEGLQPVNGIPIGNGYYRETCDDGTQFDFKSPGEGNDEAPKYDNNSTQIGQDDGNKTKPQDQNSSNSSNPKDKNKDKDNNKTSPKDPTTPNQNGNQTATPANPADPNGSNNGGESSPGSNGGSNSGTAGDGGSSSNNNKNGSNGGSDHGIPNGDPKGDNYDGLKYDSDSFRLDDIESDVKGFSDSILKRYDEFMVNFSGFKDEYNRLMGLFKGESTFESFIKPNQVNSCPRSFSIEISDSIHKNITIDICESLSKIRPALYSIFYIVFFMAFLYLTIKFSLRLFSNPFRVI